jgi:pimeloyl-ACP methyl ester carboxylesterase
LDYVRTTVADDCIEETLRPSLAAGLILNQMAYNAGKNTSVRIVPPLQQQAVYADPVVDDWPRIRARTLVIGGERDGPDYPGQARAVVAALQAGQLYLIPKIGHNPYLEAPDHLFPPLIQFLQGKDVGSKR